MTEVFPDYYPNFKCIADKCRHNCCIGWEIDIDEKTMELYKSIERDTGEKFSENIEENHFKLKEGDKCSFLRRDGLCDIICKFGESALCEICTLHPRFKNFYDNFNEVGLGLSCEEAARIILSSKDKFSVPLPVDVILTDEEKDFFAERKKVFDVLQNREKPFSERFDELCESFDIQIDTNNSITAD